MALRLGARALLFASDRIGFSLAFLAALAAGSLQLATPDTDRLPIAGDSATYHSLAEGLERLFHDPQLAGDLVAGRLALDERAALGIDRWEFQHAAGLILPLGIAYAAFPSNLGAGRAFALLLYAASAGLLWLIARRLLGRGLAGLAVAAFLLYLPFLYYGLGIATEGHAMFHLLLVAWFLLRFHRRRSLQRAVWLGVALALFALAKATYRPLVLLLLLGEIFWLLRGRRLSMGAGLAAATLVPLLLWTGVLAAARVPPSPLGAGSDHALRTYRGNYVPDQGWETTGLGDAISPELSAAEEETFGQRGSRGGGEETKERIYWGAFRRTIMRDPLGWAGLVAKKFGLFWTYPARAVVIRSFAGGYAIPRSLLCWLLPLGLVGVACVGGRRDGRWLPGALILAAAGMHALTHLVARYHVPLLPLWFIYGLLGAKAITRSLRDRVRGGGWLRLPWGWLAAGGIALGAGAFLLAPPVDLSRELARPLYLVGALLWGGAGMACVPFCLAAGPRRRAARRRLLPWFWAAGLLFCLPVTGARITEPDWDQFACRLERPGDALRQEIVLPGFLRARGAELLDTWLEIDMLRSLRGNLRLEVWAEGVCLETFRDTLGGTYESFLFDAEIHGAENRHRRLADTNAEFVRGWLNPRHGDQSPGFDYFRRWVTIPLPVGLLERDTLVVELRLTDADDGAWVQVYGDRYVDDDPRTFVGPAMGKNPFEYSHYRVAFLAGDRERMDGRLIRPRRLWSVATRSLRRHAGRWSEDLCPDWRVVKGELRVRARVRVPGRLAGEVNEEGRVVPVWVTGSPEGVTPFGPQEIRRFQWWRDHYFDGTRVL